jgi:hypothetical protein
MPTFEVIDRKQVLSILVNLLEQADECLACGTQPTAQESLAWAIGEVEALPLIFSSGSEALDFPRP